jgi:hypothetical protein
VAPTSARPYPPPTRRPGQNTTWNRRPGDGRPSRRRTARDQAFLWALRADGRLPVPGRCTHPAIPGMVFSDSSRTGLGSQAG